MIVVMMMLIVGVMINVALIFIRHNDSGDCDGSGDGSHGIDGN